MQALHEGQLNMPHLCRRRKACHRPGARAPHAQTRRAARLPARGAGTHAGTCAGRLGHKQPALAAALLLLCLRRLRKRAGPAGSRGQLRSCCGGCIGGGGAAAVSRGQCGKPVAHGAVL